MWGFLLLSQMRRQSPNCFHALFTVSTCINRLFCVKKTLLLFFTTHLHCGLLSNMNVKGNVRELQWCKMLKRD